MLLPPLGLKSPFLLVLCMLKMFPDGISFDKNIFEYDVVVVAGFAVDDMVVVVVVVDFLNQEKVEESERGMNRKDNSKVIGLVGHHLSLTQHSQAVVTHLVHHHHTTQQTAP